MMNHGNGITRPVVSRSNSSLNFRAAVMKNASNEQRQPLASTNGIAAANAPTNVFNESTEITSKDANHMHNYHGQYHPRSKSRDDNPKSTHTKEQYHERNRRPLASCNYQSNPKHRHGNSNSKHHLFTNNHTVPELIQIAHSNMDTLKPSLTAAFWNKVMKKMLLSGNNSMTNKCLPNHDDLGKRLDKILQHNLQNLYQFNPIALSQTIYSMAKLVDVLRKNKLSRSKRGENVITDKLKELLLNDDISPKAELFHSLAITAVKMIHQFEARDLSNIAYSYALIDNVPVFDDGSNLFDYIAEHAIKRVTEFNSQGLSNTVWAYATVDARHEKLFEQIACYIISSGSLELFNSQALANTVWAYAKVDVRHEKLLEKLANHIVTSSKLDRFNPQNLANIVWAYAKADIRQEKLFETVASHIVISKCLHRFNSQEIANTVWAYATVSAFHPPLSEKVANHIVSSDTLSRFNSQGLANLVWAYTKVDVRHEKLFETVANHIVASTSLSRFNPQNIANTLWAYATVGAFHPTLFEKVANCIVTSNILDRFNPQNLANTMWAYATVGSFHMKLFETAANHIVASTSLSRFNSQALANTVWAYATVGAFHPTLFDKMSSHMIKSNILDRFNSQALANTLWAFATMGIASKQLFMLCTPKAAKFHDSFNSQDLANMAWAYAVADVEAPTLFDDHFINACVGKVGLLEIKHFSQLYQWHLWRINEKSSKGLPDYLAQRCFELFISEEPRVSRFQSDVVAQLVAVGLIPKEEVLLGSGYRIDAVVEVNGKTIGVEADGPYHFIGKSKSPTGSTILKRRQVPSIDGIELVSVPYWDWDMLGQNEAKKQQYLKTLLCSS